MADQFTPVQTGMFIPTTNLWSLAQIQDANIPDDLKNLLTQLYQNMNLISLAINQKETGVYSLEEFLPGNTYFASINSNNNFRNEYRKVIFIPQLPNTGTITIPHNMFIPNISTATIISACATNENATSLIPLPFSSPVAADCISLELTDTDIVITTGSDRTSYVRVIVVVGILKD